MVLDRNKKKSPRRTIFDNRSKLLTLVWIEKNVCRRCEGRSRPKQCSPCDYIKWYHAEREKTRLYHARRLYYFLIISNLVRTLQS